MMFTSSKLTPNHASSIQTYKQTHDRHNKFKREKRGSSIHGLENLLLSDPSSLASHRLHGAGSKGYAYTPSSGSHMRCIDGGVKWGVMKGME